MFHKPGEKPQQFKFLIAGEMLYITIELHSDGGAKVYILLVHGMTLMTLVLHAI